MRRIAALAGVVVSLALTGTASARPPMPCDYWVHGCNVLAYVCDAGNGIC